MKLLRKLKGLALLLILAAAAFWLFGKISMSPVGGMMGKNSREFSVKDFDFKPATRRDIHQKVLATGTVTVKTGAEVKIGARISGQVQNLNVKIGDMIQAGDLIAVIEHEDLNARVAKFRAELKAEKARLNKVRMEGPLEINMERAQLREQEVQVALAERMLQRNMKLHQQGIVSASAVEETEEKLEVLRAKIQLAEEELKLQEIRMEQDVLLAEALVEKARANLLEEQTQLSYANITATIDGVVAFISTQEGETVVAGLSAPTFVTLIDLSRLEVTVFVDETDIGRVKIGQTAGFTVDTYTDKIFNGFVRDIHPKAVIKDNVVNYEVILEVEKENIALLRPEMTANVLVTTGIRSKALTVPKEAIKRSGKKRFVMMKEDGKVIERSVETGWREGGFMEIVSGLNEGDEVGIIIKPKMERKGKRRPRRR